MRLFLLCLLLILFGLCSADFSASLRAETFEKSDLEDLDLNGHYAFIVTLQEGTQKHNLHTVFPSRTYHVSASSVLAFFTPSDMATFAESNNDIVSSYDLLSPSMKTSGMPTCEEGEESARLSVNLIPTLVEENMERWMEDMKEVLGDNLLAIGKRESTTASSQRLVAHFLVSCEGLAPAVNALVASKETLWVERRASFSVNNKWAVWSTQSGVENYSPITSLEGINGSSQVIGISDTGIDVNSCFFYDPDNDVPYDTVSSSHRKIVTYVTYVDDSDVSTDGHGTHVCGSAAGSFVDANGDSNNPTASSYDGMADGAKLAFFDIGDSNENLYVPSDLNTDLLAVMYAAGARVFSNSWGSSVNAYDLDAQQVDQFMVENPDALVLFAAGNDGEYGAASVSTPATAKNIISVGCTMASYESWSTYYGSTLSSDYYDFTNLAYFSSQGPTNDGRMKPEIAAPGYYTTSAYSDEESGEYHCEVVAMAGTSMATPTTAGLTALAREYLVNGFYESVSFSPLGALMRAMIVHSGQPLEYLLTSTNQLESIDYPGNEQGYGRVQLDEVLYSTLIDSTGQLMLMGSSSQSENPNEYVSFSASGDAHTFTIVPSSTSAIRVTLAWTDPVAYSGTKAILVNDLDLSITTPSGETLYPSVTGGVSADHTNTVEMIDIDAPTEGGEYTITVSAYALSDLSYGDQTYGLVVTGDFCLSSTSGLSGTPSFASSHSCSSATEALTQTVLTSLSSASSSSLLGGFVGAIVLTTGVLLFMKARRSTL
jgi:hypothetical protein